MQNSLKLTRFMNYEGVIKFHFFKSICKGLVGNSTFFSRFRNTEAPLQCEYEAESGMSCIKSQLNDPSVFAFTKGQQFFSTHPYKHFYYLQFLCVCPHHFEFISNGRLTRVVYLTIAFIRPGHFACNSSSVPMVFVN